MGTSTGISGIILTKLDLLAILLILVPSTMSFWLNLNAVDMMVGELKKLTLHLSMALGFFVIMINLVVLLIHPSIIVVTKYSFCRIHYKLNMMFFGLISN